MEPHSNSERGSLGNKFEQFSHVPKEDVWERIAAEPTDRPLGAMFWAFTWAPKGRVWRRIAAELHPVPYRAIAAWSTSAAAAVALILWIGLGGSDTTPAGQGHALAQFEWCLPSPDGRPDGGPRMQDAISGTGLANGQGPKGPRTMPPSHFGTADFAAVHPHPEFPLPEQHADGPAPVALSAVATLNRRLPTLANSSSAAIDARCNFLALMRFEEAAELQRTMEAALAKRTEENEAADMSLAAQASTNLGVSPIQNTGRLSDQSNPNSFPFSIGDFAEVNSATRTPVNESFRMPVILAANVDHPITKHLNLGGGIVYTRMSSYQDGAGGGLTQHAELLRQYIGLTADVSASHPLSRRMERLAAFGNAGMQFDFGLNKSSSVASRYEGLNAAQNESVQTAVTKLGNQANAHAGLGLRYAVHKRVNLYAQGTAAHYFYFSDANLFTQKFVWPSAQVGVRVSL